MTMTNANTVNATTSTEARLNFAWQASISAKCLMQILDEIDSPTVWLPEFLAQTCPQGHRFIVFMVRQDAVIKSINVGTYRGEIVRSWLYFPSFPRCYDQSEQALALLNTGIRRFCRSKGVVRVMQNSFEAQQNHLPSHDLIIDSKQRSEYYIDLMPCLESLFSSFSTSHKRNIKKAQKQQLQVRRSTSSQTLENHFLACSETAKRRAQRNESVPSVNKPLIEKLLASDHAFILQIFDQDEIISSIFVVTTKQRAFYFSGGTTPKGTKIGAFHYLLWLTITELKNRNITSLSLGGTNQETPPGLIRFKLGFNAQQVVLTQYQLLSGYTLICQATNIFSQFFKHAKTWLGKNYYALHRFVSKLICIQSWDLFYTDKPLQQSSFNKFALRKLNRQDYELMLNAGGRLTEQAKLYYLERGIDTAYGVFDGDKLAHVCWVYGAKEYAKEPNVLLKLQVGQLELTNAYSHSDFRRQGGFRFAMQRLSKHLLANGAERVYVKVLPDNQASYKGILAIGYIPCGKVHLITGYLIPWRRGIYIGKDSAGTEK
jgi:hypothetical protein